MNCSGPSVVTNNAGNLSLNLAYQQGETINTLIQLIPINGGNPINLAGYTVKMQINMPLPLLLTTTNSDILIYNAISGIIKLNISSAASAAFPPGSYSYDLWIVSANGREQPQVGGQFVVLPTVSPVP